MEESGGGKEELEKREHGRNKENDHERGSGSIQYVLVPAIVFYFLSPITYHHLHPTCRSTSMMDFSFAFADDPLLSRLRRRDPPRPLLLHPHHRLLHVSCHHHLPPPPPPPLPTASLPPCHECARRKAVPSAVHDALCRL
jgi:hypothetical protein